MAMEISARKREAQGTGASRRLRRLGRVPVDRPASLGIHRGNLAVGQSLHVREVALAKGVELTLHKDENPVVATVVVPAVVTEEEEAAEAAAAVAPSEIPTTEQAVTPEGATAEGEKTGDKAAPKAEKPAAADK